MYIHVYAQAAGDEGAELDIAAIVDSLADASMTDADLRSCRALLTEDGEQGGVQGANVGWAQQDLESIVTEVLEDGSCSCGSAERSTGTTSASSRRSSCTS